MSEKKAFIRGIITSGGHIQLLITLILLRTLYLLTQDPVFVSIVSIIMFVILLAIHIPFTKWREKMKFFNNSNIDSDLEMINEKLVEVQKSNEEILKLLKNDPNN